MSQGADWESSCVSAPSLADQSPQYSLSECHAFGQSQISHLWARGLLAPGPVSSKRTWTRARIWDENTLLCLDSELWWAVFTISLINLHTMLIFHWNDSFMRALSGGISWLNTAHSLITSDTPQMPRRSRGGFVIHIYIACLDWIQFNVLILNLTPVAARETCWKRLWEDFNWDYPPRFKETFTTAMMIVGPRPPPPPIQISVK